MAEWVHDLGGSRGFGPVEVEPGEPPFHADWERRVFGMTATVMAQGRANGSEFRHAIERMDPGWYLASPYYEHWLTGLATLLVEKGVVDREELEAHGAPSFPISRAAARADVPPGAQADPFAVGQRVRVRSFEPRGHTRCPGYVRGHRGTVVRRDGDHTVPDVEAHSEERPAEPTYSVAFDATELWGSEAEPGATVHVDLWHRYLEAVE
ncbi:MAG: nitrile hydratase subunit beta [Actinobacteria bacterium]|nr:MAG: nitrile hydratase subunit beta [Actinomycetota bacterium]